MIERNDGDHVVVAEAGTAQESIFVVLEREELGSRESVCFVRQLGQSRKATGSWSVPITERNKPNEGQ